MSNLEFDMRHVWRYSWWLGRWVFKADGRMVTPCKWRFGP